MCNSRQQQKQFRGVLRIKSLVDVYWFERPVHKSATQKLQYGQVVKVHKKTSKLLLINFFRFHGYLQKIIFPFQHIHQSCSGWSHHSPSKMVKSHKHNSRIFNVMEISRFFFIVQWWNQLVERIYLKKRKRRNKKY